MSDKQQEKAFSDQGVKEAMDKIKHKLLVVSGKGGVGKSTIAVNLAYALAEKGFKTGILDVDIHGPSIAKMLNLEAARLAGDENKKIVPAEAGGIKVISMAFLLRNTDDPVIWRGPMKMNVIKQFLGDVNWGELDYLVIDSPPGTGDEPLSVCQLIPDADGTIIVSTPQDVAVLDSRKTVNFSRKLQIPIIGIVENMSGFKCPECGTEINLFKIGGGEKIAQEYGIPLLGVVPIDPDIMEETDKGFPYIKSYKESPAAAAFLSISEKIIEATGKK